MPQISLIIPLYNAEKYLVPCLESVARQSFRDFSASMTVRRTAPKQSSKALPKKIPVFGLSTRKTPVVRQPAITA